MTVSGVSNSSSLLALLSQVAGQSNTASTGTAASTSSGSSADPAYVLSLGSQQAQTALLGYNQLGQLVSQAGKALAKQEPDLSLWDAYGATSSSLATQYAIDVQQLAQAQILSSGGYADADQTVVGTGTLAIRLGSTDATTGGITPSGDAVTVDITDGTLDGIASAINAANAGVTAAVVQDGDGQYHLALTGNDTGAANAFTASGIAGLTYDPSAASGNGFTATQVAQDARYTVNGVAQSYPSNSGVPIAPGVVLDLTATGATTLSVPFGQQQATDAASALASSFNSVLTAIEGLVAPDGQLTDDPGVASNLAQSLLDAATESFGGGKSLADIGITTGSDGTLTVDTAKLQAAYAVDPAGTGAVLDQASAAMRQILSRAGSRGGQIQSETQALVAVMARTPTLADFLAAAANPSDSSSLFSVLDPTASSSSTSGTGSATSGITDPLLQPQS
jgi:flagellar hook-associated protein 2